MEKYVTYLEKQVKSVKEHQKNTTPPKCPTEDFTIKKIILTETDFFVPIELRNFLKKSDSRQSFSNAINALFQEGFPYIFLTVIYFTSNYHLKAPMRQFISSGNSQTSNAIIHHSS